MFLVHRVTKLVLIEYAVFHSLSPNLGKDEYSLSSWNCCGLTGNLPQTGDSCLIQRLLPPMAYPAFKYQQMGRDWPSFTVCESRPEGLPFWDPPRFCCECISAQLFLLPSLSPQLTSRTDADPKELLHKLPANIAVLVCFSDNLSQLLVYII